MIQGKVISHNPFSQRKQTGCNENPKILVNQLAGDLTGNLKKHTTRYTPRHFVLIDKLKDFFSILVVITKQ